jgi:phosphoglycolate phosphatase
MTIEAVIFDLDGTLADFNLDYKSVRAEVKSFLLNREVPTSILSTKESIFQMLDKTRIFLKNQDKPEKAVEEISQEALAIAEEYEVEASRKTSLLPSVIETLRILKKKGLKIGLFTINSQKSTEHILERFGIADFFGITVPRDNVKHVKPSTEHLEAVLEAIEVDRDEAIVVGDGVNDMKCAKDLNVIAVGFPTGFSSKEELTILEQTT